MTNVLSQTAEIAAKRGIDVVMCLISMGVLVWVLRWVFRTSAAREESMVNIVQNSFNVTQKLSEGIQTNTAAIQALTNSVKDGFVAVAKADEYHRADIKDLSEKVEDSCKAK